MWKTEACTVTFVPRSPIYLHFLHILKRKTVPYYTSFDKFGHLLLYCHDFFSVTFQLNFGFNLFSQQVELIPKPHKPHTFLTNVGHLFLEKMFSLQVK